MRALRILLRIAVGILAAIGLLAVLLAAGIGALGWRVATGEDKSVPKEAVLVLDLRQGVVERAPAGDHRRERQQTRSRCWRPAGFRISVAVERGNVRLKSDPTT